MTESWQIEFWRSVVILVIALLVGAGIDNYPLGIVLGVFFYLIWHLYNLARLDTWLSEHETAEIPESTGIWSRIFNRMRGLKRHHQQDLARLQSGLDVYRQATTAFPEGTVSLGAHDEIELINQAAGALLGLKEDQDVGSPITNLVRDPRFVDFLHSRNYSEELEIPAPVNPHLHLVFRVVPYGAMNRKLLIVRDVTRLRKLEEIRRDFVANVSHEMKSPLTVIKGYVEPMLDDKSEFATKWKKGLEQIERQTDRLCQIVEDLLQLSNLETGTSETPVPVDLPSLIRCVNGEALKLSGGRHDISLDVDNELWLLGSLNQLYSAFSNLVFNAIRHTPETGTIDIRWEELAGQGARFSVRDTGVGIPREHLPRLTERFYRVDTARSRDSGGTGLGLAIVKQVLRRHDAKLSIDSEIGAGSTFACTFPGERVIRRRALKSSA